MNKIAFVEECIEKCQEAIDSGNPHEREYLANQIIHTFNAEIPNLTAGLSNDFDADGTPFWVEDLPLLKARLRNYQSYLVGEEEKDKRELEKLKYRSLIINNTSQSTSSAASSAMLEVTYDKTLEDLDQVQDSSLSPEEKEWLEDQLAALSLPKTKRDKRKLWEKAAPVLKQIGEKSFEVAKIVLPYVVKLLTEAEG